MRLAVTDRCNLRCYYCMPSTGLDWLPAKELMTFEEMLSICSLLACMGIDKIRITGGEPFIRKNIMQFLDSLVRIPGIQKVAVTTNGVLTNSFIPELKKIGINSFNLSLDSLDRKRFISITGRDELDAVLHTLETLLQHDMDIKINAVVMEGKNTEDILQLVTLTRTLPVTVRFIEEMPFNGDSHNFPGVKWNYVRILDTIKNHFPNMQKIPDAPSSTSYNYAIPGHKGTVGVIAAYTRSFCGSCNRIRITPRGMLKTCLYDSGVFNIKDMIRKGCSRDTIESALHNALGKRVRNGWEAQKLSSDPLLHQSMAAIGG